MRKRARRQSVRKAASTPTRLYNRANLLLYLDSSVLLDSGEYSDGAADPKAVATDNVPTVLEQTGPEGSPPK